MNRECVECGCEYDSGSPEKLRAGGLIVHCPDCSEETVVRHAGVASGDGKQAAVQVLAFEEPHDRDRFLRFWAASTGLHTGKNCQISRLPSPQALSFRKVAEFGGNPNHKGKS